MTTVRRGVTYSGRVQGVGFRATSQDLASRFGVSGWVKNLPDGRVELQVQGVPGEVQALLDAIGIALGRQIDRSDVSDLPTRDDEPAGEFVIRA